MEQAKKQLKSASYMVLLFAVLNLARIITELVFGDINSAVIPDGAPANILQITKMILLAVTVIILLPKFYVGIKGLQISKNPVTSKKHITWALIILVFEAIGFIDPILGMMNNGFTMDQFVTLADVVLEVIIIYEYMKFAKEVAKLAE